MEIIFTNFIDDSAFYLISFLIIAFSLGVILESNIIRAGFSLIISFGAVAGAYFALSAPFAAASQILIYAVGITLVIIFGLMLTNLKQEMKSVEGENLKNISAALISIGIFILLSVNLTGNKWGIIEAPLSCPKNTEIIGLKLLTSYALPFELISVLLLVALIGSVVIAKKDKVENK